MNSSSCMCKNCPKRKLGCHSDCKDYKKFREKIQKMKDDKNEFFRKHGSIYYTHY